MYDVAVEITDFAMDVLPGRKTVLDIDIDRTYLLEVLPQNVYNIYDCTNAGFAENHPSVSGSVA